MAVFTKKYTHCFILVLIALLPLKTVLAADEASLSFIPKSKDKPEEFSLVIAQADKIAGMKVILAYDEDLLVFKKAEKSRDTSSFLHVVNDKKPGQVIIVMASAKGVSGNDLPLIHLSFQKRSNSTPDKCSVKVTQLQLMTESLQELKANNPEYMF